MNEPVEDVLANYFAPNDVKIAAENSAIVEFFRGKNVFITGATGFLGKLLIEKLLRACGGVDKIYILVRPKRGVDSSVRVEEIFNDMVFDRMKEIRPDYKSHIVGVEGDVSQINLGIDIQDTLKLIDNVDVIFHVAATTRFNEKIKLATAINVRGTLEILKIARRCKHLKCLVHVSTAYSHCPKNEIGEEFYPPPIDPNYLLEVTEELSDEDLETMQLSLLGDWPNSYSFTKAVAEEIIKTNSDGIPTCIYRPAIVTATFKEPYKSWMDNYFGPTFIVAGVMSGQIRVSYGNMYKIADVVPADYVINALIASAHQTALSNSDNIQIYNYVSSPENPCTWGNFVTSSMENGQQVPPKFMVWYNMVYLTDNALVYRILTLLLHYLPAIMLDLLCITQKKLSLRQQYQKVDSFSNQNRYFSTQQWKFHNDNTQNLWDKLNEVDKKAFPFSMSEFKWKDYLLTYPAGVREYILKEPWDNLDEAKKKRDRLCVVHKGLHVAIVIFLITVICWLIVQIFN
ncbi:fatty acyl-CoA reductase wat [Aethina tumida]|uniref:fatty acyl-CoA reductase wat n=1 Tax=Aethina tumida TaxID=116153 RepID=UPI0021495D3E|nr:fatty acyl-CoA reductase wat [Aethina tumida]